MLSVNMYGLWSDETEKIVKGISEATQNIAAYRKTPNRNLGMLKELHNDLRAVCCFWTGKTYIGSPKSNPIKMVFQTYCEIAPNTPKSAKNSPLKNTAAIFQEKACSRVTVYPKSISFLTIELALRSLLNWL